MTLVRKITIPDILPALLEFQKRPGCNLGCCLYTIVSNGNHEAHHVARCREVAVQMGHEHCVAMADIFAGLSETQRGKLGKYFG